MPSIWIQHAERLTEDTMSLLQATDIMKYLDNSMSVALKPNLVLARPASEGATTHPEIIEGIIRFLLDMSVKKISIMESAWVGGNTRDAFKICGYEALSKKYGVPLIDLKEDAYVTRQAAGLSISICKKILETDFVINVPVLKAHCQTLLTCSMKNLKGVIPDSEKRRFHTLGIHRPVAVLNQLVPTGYCVVDGICGDLTFEEGGNPIESNRIIAGRDPVAVDSYCAQLIGYSPEEIDYLRYGREMGLGCYPKDADILPLNPTALPKNSSSSRSFAQVGRYKAYIREDSACSACYSSLIFALRRLNPKKLKALEKICIGQGFRNKREQGMGVGSCCAGFSSYVKGCPPKALDIVEALEQK